MKFTKYKFKDICLDKGFIRGPFGSSLKKSLFVPKGNDTYKVYEQCVPLEQNKDSGNYYISGEYFRKTLSRFEVKHNDFLVSCSGVNYGAIYHIKEPFEKGVINQALLIIRINSSLVDYNYFKYLFRVLLSKSITVGTGDSTIPNFPSIDVIKDIDLQLPAIQVQKKIGRLLQVIEDKITINRKINDNLIIN
ncbi:MAG: restriction endonuclease subunit S [Succinivibrionaceae bacterium]